MIVNIILIAVILVIAFFGIKSAVSHFQGKGSCCGGGSSVVMVEPKPLEKVVSSWEISVEGMKCENCSARVQNSLNSIENVNASVNLKKKLAVVKAGEGVTEDMLKAAVEKDGYSVKEIREIKK